MKCYPNLICDDYLNTTFLMHVELGNYMHLSRAAEGGGEGRVREGKQWGEN